MGYLTEVLDSTIEKASFSCGKPMLDLYIKTQAKKDMKGRVSVCFVLTDNKRNIKGYYTLSSASIPRDQVPELILKKIPKYQDLPVTLLGRLAIDQSFQGQKLGQHLLIDALKRCLDSSKNVASFAVIVDPIDQNASDFYKKYGFIVLPDSGRMFLPMATIEQLFK